MHQVFISKDGVITIDGEEVDVDPRILELLEELEKERQYIYTMNYNYSMLLSQWVPDWQERLLKANEVLTGPVLVPDSGDVH